MSTQDKVGDLGRFLRWAFLEGHPEKGLVRGSPGWVRLSLGALLLFLWMLLLPWGVSQPRVYWVLLALPFAAIGFTYLLRNFMQFRLESKTHETIRFDSVSSWNVLAERYSSVFGRDKIVRISENAVSLIIVSILPLMLFQLFTSCFSGYRRGELGVFCGETVFPDET